MSVEDPSKEKPAEEESEKGKEEKPAVDIEAIKAAAVEAATSQFKEEMDELRANSKGVSEEDLDKLVEKRHKAFVKKLVGDEEEAAKDEAHPLHKYFAADPEGYTKDLMTKVVQFLDKRAETTKEEDTKLANAYLSVFAERQDITESDEAKEIILGYYSSESDDKSPEERFKTALNKYDKFMEKAGAGTAEERVAALQSLDKSGAKSSEGEGSSQPEDRTAALQAEQKEKVKAHKARLNGVDFQAATSAE